jgi:hypothetical protein
VAELLLVCVRVAALGLAALVGLSLGSALPIWKLDRWNEPENHAEADVLDASDPLGMYAGCGSLLPGVLAELQANCSWLAFVNLVLILGAFALAACGWPPLWLNPVKSHPLEFIVVTLFQRWIWFPLGALIIGMAAGGALSLRRQWFSSRW